MAQSQSGAGAAPGKPAKEVRIKTADKGGDEEEGGAKKAHGKHGWDESAGSDDEEQQRGRSKCKGRKNGDDGDLLLQPPVGTPAPKKQSSAWKKTVKTILGLSGTSVKLNGKKLTPNILALVLFMVSTHPATSLNP